MEGSTVNMGIDFDELIRRVKTDSLEITITVEPDRTEISIQPWKPYEMRCPYGVTKEAE